MILSFPHTNPIFFEREGSDYHNYYDAYSHEGQGCYVQPFIRNDRLTFQVCWYSSGSPFNLSVWLLQGDSKSLLASHNVSVGNIAAGTFYSDYYSQHKVGSLCNGFYVLSLPVNSIGLAVGDYFRIEVDVDASSYISNSCAVISNDDASDTTKLIHYSDSRPYVFGTYFNAVPRGYDLRLYATFLHPEPISDSVVFSGFERDLELVSAMPSENITLEIGGCVGVPDAMIKHLNHILHCDLKTVDGIRYELTEDSSIDITRTALYNLAFVSVPMATKTNEQTLSFGMSEHHVQFSLNNISNVLVVSNADDVQWHLEDDSNGFLLSLCLDRLNGIGNSRIGYSFDLNNTLVPERVYLVDDSTGSRIGIVTFGATIPIIPEGIGSRHIGDNFYIA